MNQPSGESPHGSIDPTVPPSPEVHEAFSPSTQLDDLRVIVVPRWMVHTQGLLLVALTLGGFVLGMLVRGCQDVAPVSVGHQGPVAVSASYRQRRSGELAPVEGALGMLVPASRPWDEKIDARALLEAMQDAGRLEELTQQVRSQGGDLGIASADGNVEFELPAAGEYFHLVVAPYGSNRQEPTRSTLAQMGRYLVHAYDQMSGRRFVWETTVIAGPTHLDHTFDGSE